MDSAWMEVAFAKRAGKALIAAFLMRRPGNACLIVQAKESLIWNPKLVNVIKDSSAMIALPGFAVWIVDPMDDVRIVHAFARPAGEAPDVGKRIAIPVVAFMVSVKMAHVFVWPDGMGFIVPLRDVPMDAPIMAAAKLISEENGAVIVILDGRVQIVAFDWRLVVTMDMTMTKMV